MSVEENKALARRFYDDINRGRVEVIDDIFSDDFVEHEELTPGTPPGKEGVKQFFSELMEGISAFRIDSEGDMIGEGGYVVARFVITGKHTGVLLGIPPTGKDVRVVGIDILRFSNGKLVEHWGVADNLGLMQQLGVVPAPGELVS